MSTQRTYQRLVDLCRPLRSGGTWSEDLSDTDCFLAPEHGCALLARLGDDCLEEELVTAGIARRVTDGLVLNDVLVGEGVGIVALRRPHDDFPFALMTSKGVVSVERGPLLSLEDEPTRRRMDAVGERLVVAPDIVELMRYRSAEVPVTLAADLGDPTEAGLLELKRRCRWDDDTGAVNAALPALHQERPDESDVESQQAIPLETVPTADAGDASPPPLSALSTSALPGPTAPNKPPLELILAQWSVANLDASSGGHERLVNWFLEAEFALDFDLSRVALWRPTTEEIEKVRICLAAKSVTAAGRAIRASLESSLYSPRFAGRGSTDAVEGGFDLAQAVQILEERGTARCQHEHERRRAAEKAVERDLFTRLVESAHNQGDVTDELVGLNTAFLFDELRQEVVLSRRELRQGTGSSRVHLQNVVKLSNLVLRFCGRFKNDCD